MKLIINDRIRNRTVEFFNNFSINLRYDSVASTFAFNIKFDSDNAIQTSLVEIGHYHIAKIEHNGERLITGYILSETLKSSAKTHLIPISGYSLAGTIEDCSIPPSLYPLQNNGLSLKEIAEKLTEPFPFKVIVSSSVSDKMDKAFEVSTAGEKQTIRQYLSELASQKNIILTHDSYGNLLFTQARTNTKSIIDFKEGTPFTSMTLKFNGQKMHSEITVMKQASSGNSGQVTINNPYVPYVFRPKVVIQSSGDDIDTELMAKMELAKELKDIKLTIVLDTFEANGKVIRPNNLITVINPELSIFNKSTWFIESVSITNDPKKDAAILTCVLPEVYNNEPPKYIFSLH